MVLFSSEFFYFCDFHFQLKRKSVVRELKGAVKFFFLRFLSHCRVATKCSKTFRVDHFSPTPNSITDYQIMYSLILIWLLIIFNVNMTQNIPFLSTQFEVKKILKLKKKILLCLYTRNVFLSLWNISNCSASDSYD